MSSIMRRGRGGRKNKNKNNSNGGGRNGIVKDLFSYASGAASGDTRLVRADRRQPTNWIYNMTPPLNFRFRPTWLQSNYTYSFNTLTTGVNENNIVFTYGNSNAPTNIFDQYTLDSVMCTFTTNGFSSTAGNFGTLVTAIDYDDVSNLGSVSTLRGFSTVAQTDLNNGKAISREVIPCLSLANFAGVGVSGYSPARVWVDSGNTSVQWYGLRVMVLDVQVVTSVEISLTFIWAFRNVI